ncbi:MAG: fumarylacetoacetate hydrolase family protein [Planctomycetes bacterium]|nr:fumarylacetoacetate hydrolase family protein [Planctomycetota bacterium]
MKIVQFHVPGEGQRVGIWEGETVTDITASDAGSTLTLVRRAAETHEPLDLILGRCARGKSYGFHDLNREPHAECPHLLLPVDAPEVWGCGVTYWRSASMRDEDSSQDIYSRVYRSQRPEIFFKATPSRCVGPNGDAGIRGDSKLTAAEPELAFLLGRRDQILGYTICDDVSAWDLERENPLYLPQSKTFAGCCVLGPCVATPSSVPDPAKLAITCRILRNGKTLYQGVTNSSQMKYRLETLAEFLSRHNPVSAGTVVSTGTGIMVPNDFALRPGDRIEIEIEGIGILAHGVRLLADDD